MKIPVNFEVLKNPVNWFIVLLTIVIGGFLLHTILPDKSSDNS